MSIVPFETNIKTLKVTCLVTGDVEVAELGVLLLELAHPLTLPHTFILDTVHLWEHSRIFDISK
jgi:hypothetical protein